MKDSKGLTTLDIAETLPGQVDERIIKLLPKNGALEATALSTFASFAH